MIRSVFLIHSWRWCLGILILVSLLLTAFQPDSLTQAQDSTFTATQRRLQPTATPSSAAMTPTVGGILQSAKRVNVREGPGVTFDFFTSLAPVSTVQIIGQDSTGEWLNIRLPDKREGWIPSDLIWIMPTLTPHPYLTALFLGTPLPTSTPRIMSPTPPPTRDSRPRERR
jgi:uncharacterized protein YgiM (DUF1202 family)